MNALDALLAFCLWTATACALAPLIGRVLRLNRQPDPIEVDNETDLPEVAQLCEHPRRRSDIRNGLGGAA